KILAVTGLLLLAAVSFYTLLASFIFIEQKTALLYDINHSIAVNTAVQVRASLRQVSDQLKLYTLSRLVSSKNGLRLPSSALRENHVVAFRLYKPKSDGLFPHPLSIDLPSVALDPVSLAKKVAATEAHAFWREAKAEQAAAFYLASRLEMVIGGKTETYL